MTVASLNDLGSFMTERQVFGRTLPTAPVTSQTFLTPGLGADAVLTPSGREIVLTPEEEERVAREALQWRLMQDIRGPSEMKQEAVKALLGAVGTAIGFAVGGIFLKKILGVGEESTTRR